jgi:hypothetical protein
MFFYKPSKLIRERYLDPENQIATLTTPKTSLYIVAIAWFLLVAGVIVVNSL